MNKRLLIITGLCFSFSLLFGQKANDLPEFHLEKAEIEAHLRFLAADELAGRRTGAPGNNIAARYLASYFEAYGLKKAPGLDSYFQTVPLSKKVPASSGSMTWNKENLPFGEKMIVVAGPAGEVEGEVVFAGFGWQDEEQGINDYQKIDAKGKIVVTYLGIPGSQNPLAIFNSMAKKQRIAAEQGALALVELYSLPFPWENLTRYMTRSRLQIDENDDENSAGSSLIYCWVQDPEQAYSKALKQNKKKTKISISSGGVTDDKIRSQNVIGVIEGSDPELKNEYVLLTAHYDHVGTGRDGGRFTPEDSIFNGARDNAIGTVAILSAAKILAQKPPSRSVIVLAVTGEEVGFLGSRYYADHPLIPLEKTIFDLNSDGAGYDLTDVLSVVGLDRVGVRAEIEAGAKAFGLGVTGDPVPEQGLFDRSDNVSFAAKGIPAPNISPGVSGFTEEILKYYHRPADEASSLDFDYLLTFFKAYSHIARLIADKKEKPMWAPGDKYEEVGKKLYGLD